MFPQLGDLSNAPTSCGAVFDPLRGKRLDHERQAGDLGIITAGSDGVAGLNAAPAGRLD